MDGYQLPGDGHHGYNMMGGPNVPMGMVPSGIIPGTHSMDFVGPQTFPFGPLGSLSSVTDHRQGYLKMDQSFPFKFDQPRPQYQQHDQRRQNQPPPSYQPPLPVVTQPMVTQPIVTQPMVTQPMVTQPIVPDVNKEHMVPATIPMQPTQATTATTSTMVQNQTTHEVIATESPLIATIPPKSLPIKKRPRRRTSENGEKVRKESLEEQRARWAENARLRYQRMTAEEKQEFNNKRKRRQVQKAIDSIMTTNGSAGVGDVMDHLRKENERKAAAARQRYHSMSEAQKREYNRKRTIANKMKSGESSSAELRRQKSKERLIRQHAHDSGIDLSSFEPMGDENADQEMLRSLIRAQQSAAATSGAEEEQSMSESISNQYDASEGKSEHADSTRQRIEDVQVALALDRLKRIQEVDALFGTRKDPAAKVSSPTKKPKKAPKTPKQPKKAKKPKPAVERRVMPSREARARGAGIFSDDQVYASDFEDDN